MDQRRQFLNEYVHFLFGCQAEQEGIKLYIILLFHIISQQCGAR